MFTIFTSTQEIENKELVRNKILKDEKRRGGKLLDDCTTLYIKIRNKLAGINNPHAWSIIGLR